MSLFHSTIGITAVPSPGVIPVRVHKANPHLPIFEGIYVFACIPAALNKQIVPIIVKGISEYVDDLCVCGMLGRD